MKIRLRTSVIIIAVLGNLFSSNSASAADPAGDPVTNEVIVSTQHPLNGQKDAKFGFRFRSKPSPGNASIIDISFNSDNFTESEWQHYHDDLVKYSPIREVLRDFFTYTLKNSGKIDTSYATLEFGLFCKNLAGNNMNVAYFKVHRLLAPYTSYEIPSSLLSFESYNQGPYNGRGGSIVLDEKSTVSYSLPSTCASFWISSVRSYIWIGVSGLWLKSANGEMLNVGDGTARIPIRTSAWNDLAVELSTFKVKTSPTPKVTSTPKSSSEPSRIQTESTTKATIITCVKGKLTKQVTAVNPKCPAGYKKK